MNGCYNRPPLAERFIAQDGWWIDGHSKVAKVTSIVNKNSRECQYQKHDKYADARCVGCKHKQ